jgi:hypothetical protein
MRKLSVLALLLVVACSDGAATTTTSAAPSTTSTTVAPTTTTTVVECGAIPYELAALPARVDAERPLTDDVPRDQFTTIPGTRSRLWFDGEGDLAVAFIRGSLPPLEWPGDRGEVSVDGARGVAGPLDDGSWMVAWFEGEGDPCDQFFIVFYPPVEPSEVEAAVASLDRTAG